MLGSPRLTTLSNMVRPIRGIAQTWSVVVPISSVASSHASASETK